ITGGTLSIGTAGISFGAGGNGTSSYTAAGTLAAINTALDAATFTPTPNLSGVNAGTISFTTKDGTDTSSPASVSFNINDTSIPTLTSSVPIDNADNAYLGTNIVLDFDDNMVAGTGNITIRRLNDDTVFEQIAINDPKITITSNQVIINPAGILSRGLAYYIEIDATALDDDAGNSFAGISGSSTLNFTAVDVLINEVVTDPQQDWSTHDFIGIIGDGAISTGTDEWIELLINSNGIDLSGWTLELLDGTDVVGDLTNTGAFDDIVFSGIGSFNNTNSGDYLILGNVDGSGAMNNSITINLKDPSGAIVDAVVIGGGAGEAPSGNADNIYNESIQRFFNGLDTDVHDNDFTLGMASLGSANTGPSVTLSASTATIAEAAGISTLTAELSEISSQDVTVTLAVDGSSSAVLTDYTLSSASIVINAGIAFNTTSSNASEAIGSANLKVDLSDISGLTVTVDYTLTGTATDADYALTDGTLTIAPGNENENITIASIVNDLLDENNETVIVTLTNPTNATLGTNTVHTYTINDNDATPSIAFKTTSSSGLETLVSADLQVNLSAESGLDVTVDYTVSGTATEADYILENGTLTIGSGEDSENITITNIVNDFLDETNETVILTLSNPVNATLGTNTVHTYTINDDDVTGFSFAETDGDTQVFESGANDSFTVQLDVIPSSNVVIDLVNGNISEISLSTANLTFTPDNWNVPQVVSLNTVDDNYADGDQNVIITLSINDANSDDAFDNLADETVIVTSVDDEVPGFSLSKTTAIISEDGGTDNFTVVLDLSSGDTGEVTVSSPSLTFTTGNWDTPQTIDLTGIDDAIVDGNKNVSITIAVNDARSDNVFDAVPNQSVICTNEDNEEAGFTFRETDAYTLVKETHTTDQFSVVLNGQPASDVVLNISSGDTGEATVSSSSLTFTYDNWNISQTVIVTGVDDAIADGSQETTITISVNAPGSHDAFDSLEDKEVTVINVDDDTAGFTISQTNGGPKVNEIGIIDTMWVVLNKQPASDVVLGFESSDENEIIREHDENRFTVSNWNMPQDFRIRGMADYIVDGEVYTDLTIKVLDAYSDNAYDALPDRVISVVNIDNDIASFSLSPANLNVVEDHGTETFKITLGTAAEGDVSFNIASSDDGVVTVSHSSITIPAGNTESANITLTIQDDDIADGTKDANIIVSINQAVSFDPFDDLEDEKLPIQVTDDEVIELIVAG
ncbi:cadherin domain-containing protein, partial [Aduncisulcus paluster]